MITVTTNGRVDNVEIVGVSSSTWTITGTVQDCRFSDSTGSVTINGDVDTLVDNLMIYGGAATVLTVSGSEQTVQAKVHVAAAVNAVDISGADNTVDLAVENVRHTGVTVSGNRNRVTLNEQLNQTADDTYDAVIVSGDNNHVTGTAQIEAVNTPQYGADVSGDNNYVCVYCPDATTGETNDAGANNRFCLHTDSDLSGLDATAIHDNVAAEISAIAAKGAPTAADYLVIEDAAAADAKKSITIGTIPVTEAQITDLDHTDTAAIHDNVAAEISAVAAKAVPTAADYLLIEDAAAADAKKSITIGDIPVTEAQISDLDHTDATAIHDNVAAEISAIAAKAVPTTADYLVIEDAAAGNAKKSITIGDIDSGLLGDVTDWTTWSPSYSNLTVGNGTVVARYTQIGKTIIAHFEFTLGSTSAVGSNPGISLPVSMSATYLNTLNVVGWCQCNDDDGSVFYGPVRINTSAEQFRPVVGSAGGTYLGQTSITATVPMTWTTDDTLVFSATYEAA